MPTWTALGPKIPVKFWDPANTSNFFSPQINPVTISRTPGNVRKYVKTANGTSIISGDREYPPIEIKITWDELDYSDYLAISQFTAIDPIVFSDNNNQGYLGVFVIDKAGQVAGKTSNVWAVEAAFLVLAPYNGATGTINNLTPPSNWTFQVYTTGGYITSPNTFYFWPTVFTPWGESTVGLGSGITATTGSNNYFVLSWAQPSSPYFTKFRWYWNSTNDPTSATLLTEVQAGQIGSFTVYSNYVAYNTVNPPLYTTAFTGYWNGSLWTQQ